MSTSAGWILPADPGSAFRSQQQQLEAVVLRVMRSGNYLLAEETRNFEAEFAAYLGTPHCVAVGSGTAALQLALTALDIGPGDAVIAPSFTAVATVAAIAATGATPLLVDIELSSFCLDPALVEATVQARTDLRIRAILPVHLYGHPAAMAALRSVAVRWGLHLVEDSAQSHGATIDGRITGSWGDLAAFSFYPTKNLPAMGDAGAVVTPDPEVAARLRRLQQYGWRTRHVSEEVGTNTRMDEIQAAVLRVRLPALERENQRRREIARRYTDALRAAPVQLPREAPGCRHVYHQYVIRCADRDHLQKHLHSRGILAQVLYPQPVHLQPAYAASVLIGEGGLSVSEELSREILSLPVHPGLTDRQVDAVIEAVCSWPGGLRA